MAGVEVIDRDQGQAQVAYFLEQSMRRRLVGYRTVAAVGNVRACRMAVFFTIGAAGGSVS